MTINQKEQIKRLREAGYGYGKIAAMLDISDNTVKSYCRRNGLIGMAGFGIKTADDKHVCKYCGLSIKQSLGRKEKKFCSYACRMSWWKEHPDQVNRKAIYEFECAYCHKAFTAYGNSNRKYCSHRCYLADRFGGDFID